MIFERPRASLGHHQKGKDHQVCGEGVVRLQGDAAGGLPHSP